MEWCGKGVHEDRGTEFPGQGSKGLVVRTKNGRGSYANVGVQVRGYEVARATGFVRRVFDPGIQRIQ